MCLPAPAGCHAIAAWGSRELAGVVAGDHCYGNGSEGVFTTIAAVLLAKARSVEMPITEQMHAILNEGKSPRDV